jgi:hypothetical protein
MGLNIVELFGYGAKDFSPLAQSARNSFECPFLGTRCTKQLRDGTPSGACTVKQRAAAPCTCCPRDLCYTEGRGSPLSRALTGEPASPLSESPVTCWIGGAKN